DATKTCSISIVFGPKAGGAKTAILSVTGTGGEAAVANLTGTGAGTGLTIAPPSVNFGTIGIGNTVDRTLTVTNTGTASTMVTPTLGGANASQFTIMANNCTGALAANGTCTIVIRFAPTTANDKSALLTVTGSN